MHKILSSLACALVACAPLAAIADNHGEIRFEGRINNATCKVDGGGTGSPSFTVRLPEVSKVQLAQLGDGEHASRTRFSMRLHDCQDVLGTVRAYFEAGALVDPITHTLRPSNNGPVHFALIDQDDTQIRIGSELQAGAGYAANETMYYDVAYQRIGAAGAIVAGDFDSRVTYSLQYD
jgi:type 1 fimbria pilin